MGVRLEAMRAREKTHGDRQTICQTVSTLKLHSRTFRLICLIYAKVYKFLLLYANVR